MSKPFRVITTPTAFADLEAYIAYIKRESPQNALHQSRKVIRAILSLDFMPQRFKIVIPASGARSAVRAMVVHPLIVYYRVDDQKRAVRVLRIVHGAMQQPERF